MDSPPVFRNSSTQRTALFNKLKPCCLEIVKTLRRGGASPPNGAVAAASLSTTNTLIGLTETLYGILTEQANYNAAVLDAAMADYAFFPLLPIFQRMDGSGAYPARLLENATNCLRVLIQYGWKTAISKENAQHFLILLTSVVAGGAPRPIGPRKKGGAQNPAPPPPPPTGPPLPEETVTAGYAALAALMRTAGAASTSTAGPRPGPDLGTGLGSGSSSPLVAANVVPALAHAVTVMLAGVTDSVVPAVQLAALDAVEALYATIKDAEVLASFFPGTVSSLVRSVALPGAHKAPKRVIVRTLAVLFAVLVNTLGDVQTRRLRLSTERKGGASPSLPPPSSSSPSPSPPASMTKSKLDAAWLDATASQVKVALATVLKLRNHASDDVRDAVHRFCIGLLDECHASLSTCTELLVESAIVTMRGDGDEEAAASVAAAHEGARVGALGALRTDSFRSFGPETTLHDLAVLYPELAAVVQSTAYHWASGLPRAMQASDEDAKQRALRNLQKAMAMLRALHVESATLQSAFTAALRDSVVTLALTAASSSLSSSSQANAVVGDGDADDVALIQGDGSGEGGDLVRAAGPPAYRPTLLALNSQKGTREAVLHLIANVGSASQQARLAADMLEFVRDTRGLDQVAALWLAFELVKASLASSADLDSLLDLASLADDSGAAASDGNAEAVLGDLFSFAVSTLDGHSDTSDVSDSTSTADHDWRLGAIALEVTAFAASRLREAFRPELIDVLYPVATYLGAPEARLRAHAITTLNRLAASCGYASVSALIVDNVDYMLNSVSLRLNTFDISPAATKVLTMMLRLAGPRLVPYLDDVVAAIFAALDNYHGYPLFVENLFAVLGEVVQQSVKAPVLLLTDESSKAGGAALRHAKKRPDAPSTDDLVDLLDRRAKRRKRLDDKGKDDEEDAHAAHAPQRPWKSQADELLRAQEKMAKAGEDHDDGAGDENNDTAATEADADADADLTKPEDPKTPTYALLARITTLTQHYLTSPTPTLRKSLLDLLATVAPALAPDENAFLPLVNAIWPVVITRLYDGEPYVVVAACHALAALCASAGDFLATRIKAEWHANLHKWCVRLKADAAAKVRGGGGGTSRANVPALVRLHDRPFTAADKGLAASVTGGIASTGQVLISARSAAGDGNGPGPAQLVQLSSSPFAASSSSLSTAGLGRFAQAVQLWEAAAGLLTAVVAYVRLDDDVYDVVVDLLLAPARVARQDGVHRSSSTNPDNVDNVRLLPAAAEQAACAALAAVNADAVWLTRYRTGQLDADEMAGLRAREPSLAGVHFAPVG